MKITVEFPNDQDDRINEAFSAKTVFSGLSGKKKDEPVADFIVRKLTNYVKSVTNGNIRAKSKQEAEENAPII